MGTPIYRAEWKKYLQERGAWESFLARRDELKESGMAPRKAYLAAQAEFSQSLGNPPSIAQSAPKEDADPLAFSVDGPESQRTAAGEWQPPMQLLPAVARREDFQQFDAPADVVVRWVAGNMWLMDVKAADAPCPEAWYLLWQCRTDPGSRTEFWRGTYPRLLSKSDAERDGLRDDNIRLSKLIGAVAEGLGMVQRAAEETPAGPVADAGESSGYAVVEDDEPEGPYEHQAEELDP